MLYYKILLDTFSDELLNQKRASRSDKQEGLEASYLTSHEKRLPDPANQPSAEAQDDTYSGMTSSSNIVLGARPAMKNISNQCDTEERLSRYSQPKALGKAEVKHL